MAGAESSDADAGAAIGRYQLVGRLATGGMAEIWLGRLLGPAGFEKPVVIKRVLPHLAGSPGFAQMFLDEARLCARIQHPNVVHVHELGLERGALFLAMEYLEGESVAGILRRLWREQRRMEPAAAALIAAAACAGLHAAHELTDLHGAPLQLVHRDVSPGNLFVTYDGQVKVLDFGVAKAEGRATRTESGLVKGKSAYMSPEQALARKLDRRSDIFSLGTVLFEMCTMRRLFDRESPALVYRAICEQPIPSILEVASDLPASLGRVAQRALARPLEERYQTAQEMRRDLLAAARALTASEPEELLGPMMRALFPERLVEKREMLRRLEAGAEVSSLPDAEADLGVSVPLMTAATAAAPSAADAATRGGRRRPPQGRRLLAAAAGVLALGGAVFGAVSAGRRAGSAGAASSVGLTTAGGAPPPAAPPPITATKRERPPADTTPATTLAAPVPMVGAPEALPVVHRRRPPRRAAAPSASSQGTPAVEPAAPAPAEPAPAARPAPAHDPGAAPEPVKVAAPGFRRFD
jgi:serine/threonine-protein kinase